MTILLRLSLASLLILLGVIPRAGGQLEDDSKSNGDRSVMVLSLLHRIQIAQSAEGIDSFLYDASHGYIDFPRNGVRVERISSSASSAPGGTDLIRTFDSNGQLERITRWDVFGELARTVVFERAPTGKVTSISYKYHSGTWVDGYDPSYTVHIDRIDGLEMKSMSIQSTVGDETGRIDLTYDRLGTLLRISLSGQAIIDESFGFESYFFDFSDGEALGQLYGRSSESGEELLAEVSAKENADCRETVLLCNGERRLLKSEQLDDIGDVIRYSTMLPDDDFSKSEVVLRWRDTGELRFHERVTLREGNFQCDTWLHESNGRLIVSSSAGSGDKHLDDYNFEYTDDDWGNWTKRVQSRSLLDGVASNEPFETLSRNLIYFGAE